MRLHCLNRHLLAARFDVRDVSAVQKESKLTERATAWMDLFSPGGAKAVKSESPWSQHIELREERNAIMHALLPSLGLSPKEVPMFLNAVREGVGGLLCRLQRLRGGPRLGFMLRLSSAPKPQRAVAGRARRKPKYPTRSSGGILFRLAERQCTGASFQDPPRNTRCVGAASAFMGSGLVASAVP